MGDQRAVASGAGLGQEQNVQRERHLFVQCGLGPTDLRLAFIATPLFTPPPSPDVTSRPPLPTRQEALSLALLSHHPLALFYTLPQDRCPCPALPLVAPGSLSPNAEPSLHRWSKGKGWDPRAGRGFGGDTTGAQDLDAAPAPFAATDSRF